jgi:hypothetical protein
MTVKTAPLVKLEPADLAIIRQRAELSGEIDRLVEGSATVVEAIDLLSRNGHLVEATRVMAHAMPRREAVWWACMCARHTQPSDLTPADMAALEAAELWVRKPTDENRRAAFALAQEAGFGTSEAWSGVAAFWSGDSMSPLGQPAVPPAPNLTGAAVAGSVALSSVRVRPAMQMQRLRTFLGSAYEIAAGGTGRLAPEDAAPPNDGGRT